MRYVDERLFWKQFFIVLSIGLLICTRNVLADHEVRKVKFHEYLASGGDYRTLLDSENRMEYDYMKVVVMGKKGDKYDVRLKYSPDWFITKKTLAVKKGLIGKKFKKNIIYFIPELGKCPGKKNQCVRVPVRKNVSTEYKIIDTRETLWGIELYNGSAKGLLMEIKGYYSFMNYDE